jgi:CheY-like chemotaxis protein
MSQYKHILLAEDDEDDIAFFLEVLNAVAPQMRYTVALNGHEALELLLHEPEVYDLIFLDLNMPLVGGFDFLKRRKTENTWCDIPVVVLTTSLGDEEQSYKLGANLYVTKPASTMAYQTILATILSKNIITDQKFLRDLVSYKVEQSE